MSRLAFFWADELPFGKRILTLGSKGQDVQYLQALLSKLGIYDGEQLGCYDLLTIEAVKAFQKSYQLPVDGVTGPDTSKMLAESNIHNRLVYEPRTGETLSTIAAKYGVGIQAIKGPESRKRLRKVDFERKALIEKRDIILGVSQEGETNSINSYFPASLGQDLLHVKLEELEVLTKKERRFPSCRSLVLDMTGKTTPRLLKKVLQWLRCENEVEIIWWTHEKNLLFPRANEADCLIISPQIWKTMTDWSREIRKILLNYPCTRLLLHFDLRGRENNQEGEERFLSARESKVVHLNKIGNPRRLGETGWLHYRYKTKEKEREVLLPDRRTIRGILNRVDGFNLRGVLFTGIQDWVETLQEESNRYFLANPRKMVINKQGLA